MPRINRIVILISVFAVLGLGAARSAQAEPITLIIPDSAITPAINTGVLTLGFITNNTGAPILSPNLTLVLSNIDPALMVVNNNFPRSFSPFTIQNGATSQLLSFASIRFNPSAVVGQTYTFDISIRDDANMNVSNVVRISVTPAGPAVIPEPTTVLLLGTGLAGVIAGVRRRHKANGAG